MNKNKNMVPFWTWNKRVSHMTLTPVRVASGKASFNQRVLQSLRGGLMYRNAQTFLRKNRRNRREALIWASKLATRSH